MDNLSLFHFSPTARPLADRLRPTDLEHMIGHQRWLGATSPLRQILDGGKIPSMILWGPPGCGKTTLARIIAAKSGLSSQSLSAVTASIKEVKEIMEQARSEFATHGRPTLLFVDEIHRFNRSQQDAFLPFVESGEIILVGTTTENPSFEINSALLSRLRVVRFDPLTPDDLVAILERTFQHDEHAKRFHEAIHRDVLQILAQQAQGDARAALNQLEALLLYLEMSKSPQPITPESLPTILSKILPKYDKNRDQHYDLISALHKSLRNSDVQASLYWLARMIAGGEDPLYIARRLVRFASEDIGVAEPQALRATLDAKDAVDFIGLPEGALALAQAVVILATAPKSNSIYKAYKAVESDLDQGQNYSVPLHLRNAVTKLMRQEDYGKGYQYAHDETAKTASMECLPAELKGRIYYTPQEIGLEKTIKTRMDYWNEKRKEKGSDKIKQ